MRAVLLDTGPIVAYLRRTDPAHQSVAAWLDAYRGILHSTSAVLTEAMHFVGAHPVGPTLLAELVVSSGLEVHDFAQPSDLRSAADLMVRYGDAPMDYADATLLLLADRIGLSEILTLDRRGFRIFRTPKGSALRLALDED